MRALFPLTVSCITLLALPPAGSAAPRGRFSFLRSLEDTQGPRVPTHEMLASPKVSHKAALEAKQALWKLFLYKGQPPKQDSTSPVLNKQPFWVDETTQPKTKLRVRRHSHDGSRGHGRHPQLMRVGCVLGTCQVQNLSHRLYQLIGQSGREDSSPINPKSPHSYG